MSEAPTWWVIFHEPNPAQMNIVAVEPAPIDPDHQDARCAEFTEAGQRAYVITATDPDAASEIAGRVWAKELVTTPSRLAAADAYLTANARTE
ncbi:hypothetical protein [Streptomyces sp. NPDC048385]|uniref:hypothetical protein n=1 Tax=Streptomyces sp. NPDC048385 TaxID=3155145 RepID=UPI0034355E3C